MKEMSKTVYFQSYSV